MTRRTESSSSTSRDGFVAAGRVKCTPVPSVCAIDRRCAICVRFCTSASADAQWSEPFVLSVGGVLPDRAGMRLMRESLRFHMSCQLQRPSRLGLGWIAPVVRDLNVASTTCPPPATSLSLKTILPPASWSRASSRPKASMWWPRKTGSRRYICFARCGNTAPRRSYLVLLDLAMPP